MSLDQITEQYVDINEVARILRIHPMSTWRLHKEGRLPAGRMFAHKWLFEREAIERFALTYDRAPGRKPRSRRLL